MAYVRKRTTKAGMVSTALVEAYRDEQGRPRQRILANLHGEPDTLRAWARLEYRRVHLRKHREKEWAKTQQWAEGDKELVAEFFAKLDDDLAVIEREIAIIKNHCTATPAQIQAAIKDHERALDDAVAVATGSLMVTWQHQDAHKAHKAALRRLRA